MAKRVEIVSKIELLKKSIFRVEEVQFKIPHNNGTMSDTLVRLNLDRGDSVAGIVHDIEEDTVVLVEQFRYPAYEKGPGWLFELPAGILDASCDLNPEETLKRELEEEVGFRFHETLLINSFYLSPGGSSERLYLYYVPVCRNDKIGDGGGLHEKGEFVDPVILSVEEAFKRLDHGEIIDAKTIIGLQWLRTNRT